MGSKHRGHTTARGRVSRRELFRSAGAAGLGAIASPGISLDAQIRSGNPRQGEASAASGVYQALGVRPLINCRGTLTIIGGSMELPEVREAKSLANQQYVHLDELMDAVGKRLAELTRAEWGMVSSGCAAAMSYATAACVAGGNPDLHVRIPDLRGFLKTEVIIPTHSRNVYDVAIAAVGVRIIEVETPEDLRQALGPHTAMIYVFANDRNETGPMSLQAIADIARPYNVPIMVDAAAEVLTIPSVHLQRGATLVGYSGGKIIRGPQSAGLLLGRKDLVQAAWIHSAPHHGFGRAMKVGREEVIGMLTAVESWVRRNHDAEWAEWVARCEHIAARVAKIPGVTATVRREPGPSLSNRSPGLAIRWSTAALGITGPEISELLYNTEPRIALNAAGAQNDGPGDTGISLTTSMMASGDEKIVAERVVRVLSERRAPKQAARLEPPVTNLSGRWTVAIEYTAGRTSHTLHLQQEGSNLTGTHQGDFVARDIAGTITGSSVSLASIVTEEHGFALTYRFTGSLTGDTISGTLNLGEYRSARWTARRHVFTPRSAR